MRCSLSDSLLRVIPTTSIHVISDGETSLFPKAEGCCFAYAYHIVFLCFFIGGPLYSFHVLAIVNTVSVNMGVHVFLHVSAFFFLGYIRKSRIAGSLESSSVH